MYVIQPNSLIRSLYPSAVWRIPTKEKKIYLTFDDGPIPEVTPWVLDLLKQYQVKATFFCVGENIEKHPAIFQQIISEGHAIGNHTYHHLNGWKTNTKEYIRNVEKAHKIMVNGKWLMVNGHQPSATSHQPFLFRPPYGMMKPSQHSMLRTQYSLIMWDVLTGDFDQTISPEKCLKNALTKTREGSIIVFHDSLKAKKNLLFALPKFLEYFSEKGFQFTTL